VGGGFQAAVGKPWRGGVGKLKSLTARQHADVALQVRVGNDEQPARWEYELRFAQDRITLPAIKEERVTKEGKELLKRPNGQDREAPFGLTQTYLEQASVNQEFRELTEFFASVCYLHLIPQVIRNVLYAGGSSEAFGGDFLRRIADAPEKSRQ